MNESKRNAKNKYRAKVEELRVELYPTDADIKERIAERLAAGEKKASYIKRLIREDIYNSKIAPIVEKVRVLREYHLSDEDICRQIGLTKEEFYSYLREYPQFFMAARSFNIPRREGINDEEGINE